ncbi:MAG TPA: helix-turn-helix domain containing protein [Candidatus Ligilactobacillus excrementavium]|nr:helix-turn-helix domain containing protein [Candidatus Ligilactobacillus excrementavium]
MSVCKPLLASYKDKRRLRQAAKRLKASRSTIESWLRAYRAAGETGLAESHT